MAWLSRCAPFTQIEPGGKQRVKNFFMLLRRHPVLGSAFLLALFATVFFAIRTTTFAVYWADPAHRNLEVQGWMTPGYVAHSWSVPREVMRQAVGPLPDKRRPTLDEIAAEQDIDLETLAERIQKAIAAHRQATSE